MKKITQNDVLGWFDSNHNLINRGMVVAQGFSGSQCSPDEFESWKEKLQVSNICPVWKDKLPYKSVTVICNADQENEVTYWLSYVHGGEYSKRKVLKNGQVAFRSNYQCW